MGKTESEVLYYISKNNQISIVKLSQIIGLSDTAIGNALKKLKDKGVLKRIGQRRVGIGKL